MSLIANASQENIDPFEELMATVQHAHALYDDHCQGFADHRFEINRLLGKTADLTNRLMLIREEDSFVRRWQHLWLWVIGR